MASFGISLAVLALLDVLLTLPGRRPVPVAVTAAPAVAAAGAWTTGHAPAAALLFAASVLAVEVPVWCYATRRRRPALALALIGAALLGRIVTTPAWTAGDPRPVAERWTADVPFAFAAVGSPRIVLVAGTALFLATAGNTVVRLLLHSLPAVDLNGADKLPGGGRIIGSLERLLIFGLALAGEATAAALVVSAKGLLRFAEVRAAPGEDVDRVTEYVLVGSLASYTLALAFVPLASP